MWSLGVVREGGRRKKKCPRWKEPRSARDGHFFLGNARYRDFCLGVSEHPCSTKRVGTCIVRNVSVFDERFNRSGEELTRLTWRDDVGERVGKTSNARCDWFPGLSRIHSRTTITRQCFSVGDREREKERERQKREKYNKRDNDERS